MRRLFVLLFFIASPLYALGPFSSLGGRVTDGGAPLGGATVTLTSALLQQPRETTTAANGTYWIPALEPGVYDLTISLAKHQTITRRAELHIGEQARIDVELAASEEEETVSSTESRESVLEEPRSVFSVEGTTLNVLPIDRIASALRVDEQRSRRPLDVPLDAVRELAFPISTPQFTEPLVLVTRNATNALDASVRGTLQEGGQETIEATTGGAAIDDRLWLYGFVLSRDEATTGHARVTLSAGARDSFSVFAHDTLGATWLHSDARLTTFATATRHSTAAQAFFFANGHELSARGERIGAENRFFVRDHIVFNDFSFEGFVRVDDDGDVAPRVGATYGRGSRRVAAWLDDASDEIGGAFAQYLRGGYVRATLLHRNDETVLIADATAKWLIFTFGGLARYEDRNATAAAWMIIEPPLLDHPTTIAVLSRYDERFALDVAVTYGYARSRVTPFVKVEGLDLLREERSWRIGIGARL